jgi:N-methylhydantoinase B
MAGDLGSLATAADLAPLAPLDDLRASAAYRHDATLTLLRRALRGMVSA